MVIVESRSGASPYGPDAYLNFATMRHTILLTLLLSCTTLSTQAQDRGLGLGVMIGDPTGLSGKVWTSGDRAFDFGLAWGPWHSGYLHMHADMLFHNMGLIQVSSGKLPLYYGPGLRMRAWGRGGYWDRGRYYDHDGTHVTLGIRFPVGLAYLFDGAPVDVFMEVAPTLDVVPATYVNFDAGLGVRYYFN